MSHHRLAPPVPRPAPGDPTDAERLLEVLPVVRALLHRICWSPSDVDDLTQEVLIEVARALPRFEGRSQLTTYVHTITVRVAYRWLGATAKRRERESPLDLVAPPADTLDPESRALAREALRRLYRALDRLAPKLRVAFLLCDVYGLDPSEAATAEGVSSGTIRARLFRARVEVRRRLGNDPYLARLIDGAAPDGDTEETSDV
jgi:RNA polymerase sigma-70 factor (ECF subfamily)